MERLWEAALGKPAAEAIAFNSAENIRLDERLVGYDIAGSIAHAQMLGKRKIIKPAEAAAIVAALRKVYGQHRAKKFRLNPSLEDVHTNVENAVSALTPAGGKMHTARSRNDQVMLDMRLWMRDEALAAALEIVQLQHAFCVLSKKDGMMVSYTHTRVAQPITISFWCEAQAEGLSRDLARLCECLARLDENPLGAGAIAGSGWNVDRHYTAKRLAFSSVQKNEMDTVSSRGELEAELAGHLALLGVRLSGMAEELIWLSQKGLIHLPDAYCTGSSLMPNKRNPDVLELVRGRAARVAARHAQMLAVKKGLMGGYHSDLQETKGAVMDAVDTARKCVRMMTRVVPLVRFDSARIGHELEMGYAQATELADALVKKGVPFRDAHGAVGKRVRECEKNKIGLSQAEKMGWVADGVFSRLSSTEWKTALTLSRPRLKRNVKVNGALERALKNRQKKIAKAYGLLLNTRLPAGSLDVL